jgi:KDO2-lipid IV(A) lauroyltransferase
MPLGTLAQFFIPRWLTVRVARLLGPLMPGLAPRRAATVRDNLRRILGPRATADELDHLCRSTFTNLLQNTFDLLRLPVLRRRVACLAEFDRSPLDAAVSQGRGVILATAHVANWDLAGAFIAALGYPISAVVEPVPGGWMETFDRYRRATAMETIPIPDTAGLRTAVRSGRVIALVADRDLTGNGLDCPAFGASRSFPRGPAFFALRNRVPLVIGIINFQGRPGRPPYHVRVEPVEFTPTGAFAADVDELTRRLAARLNGWVARYPDQWLVFQPGWR